MQWLGVYEEYKAFIIMLNRDSWFNKVSNTSELDKALGNHDKSSSAWKYSIPKVEFNSICLDRHIRPNIVNEKIKEDSGYASLVLSVGCTCSTEPPSRNLHDPIAALALKITVQFSYLDKEINDFKTLHNSWHLDRHDPTKQISSIHPLYHYEYGGSELTKAEEFDYGNFILLDTPRIMHPPLDIVLGIDFVIKNYYDNKEHKHLTNSEIYKRYIKNAKQRIWKPYVLSLASHFYDFQNQYNIDKGFAANIVECMNYRP